MTQTFPEDFAEAISPSEAVGVGAGLDEAFFGAAMELAEADVVGAVEGLEDAAVEPPAVELPDDAGDEAGAESEEAAADLDFLLFFVEPVLAEASAAGALAFDASAAEAAVASLDALSDFLLRLDFLAGVASAAVAEVSAAAASASDFFFRFDFLVVEASAVAAELSAAAASSDFLLLFDFFGAEASVVAAELSAEFASAFLLFFEDFFVVELSAGVAELSAEAASAFLDFFDFFFVVVV